MHGNDDEMLQIIRSNLLISLLTRSSQNVSLTIVYTGGLRVDFIILNVECRML